LGLEAVLVWLRKGPLEDREEGGVVGHQEARAVEQEDPQVAANSA